MPNQPENIASQAGGALKAIKAKIEGLTGVFAQLSREHGEVTVMLQRVKASSDPRVREEFFPKIRTELLSHERGELSAVYPAFRTRPELETFADEHAAEAQDLEHQIAVLAGTDYADPSWPGRFDTLVDLVSKHVKEEEGTFFPAASRVFGREESDRLLGQYQAAKADIAKGESR